MSLFSGLVDLPWWGYGIAALALTHVTIVAVAVFGIRSLAEFSVLLRRYA